jgi:hypothetical protein
MVYIGVAWNLIARHLTHIFKEYGFINPQNLKEYSLYILILEFFRRGF